MGKNGLLIDEMHNKVNTAKKCEPEEAFKIMLEEDRILAKLSELLSNTGISGVHPIGYECQSSKINELSRNMNKLLAYPEKLIKEYYSEFDGDLANEIRQSCERLSNFYFDSIVYKNSVTDELIEKPLYQFSRIYAKVNSAIENIKEAPIGFLIVTARTNRNPAIRERVETELKERYRNLGYKGNDDLALMFPYLEMEDHIADFESNNPDIAEKIDAFLNHPEIAKRDDIYLRYYIYSADPKYRNLLIDNIEDYKIANINCDRTAYFSPSGKDAGINISYKDNLYYSYFEPYTSIFHEMGHATDYHNDKLGGKKKYDIEEFTMTHIDPQTGEEQQWTVREAINYDVFDNPNNPHSIYSTCEKRARIDYYENLDTVINAIKNNDKNSLEQKDKRLYDRIVDYINDDLKQAYSRSPSDIYRGVTTNALEGKYVHEKEYYDKVWDENDFDYNNPTKELWAEWFSYHLTGNEEAIAVTKEFFPTATVYLEEYVNENWK